MKKVLVWGFALAMFLVPGTVSAQEEPSCEDLVEIANVLDDVADVLSEIGYIKEDSELDRALGEVLDALELLSDVEKNKSVTRSVSQLADAWDKMDWKTFKLALDSLVANLDRLRRADCE